MMRRLQPALIPFGMLPLLWACGQADGMVTEDIASTSSAMIARSNVGPALAYFNARPGRPNAVFLFFKGHNNFNVWTSMTGGLDWPDAEIVRDRESPESFAFTKSRPSAFAYTLPAIDVGLTPRWRSSNVYLGFVGHNNSSVWLTKRYIWEASDGDYPEDWRTPVTIPDAQSNYAPAMTVHDWRSDPLNKIFTVAWTALDGTIKLKRATEPPIVHHEWPFDYRDVTGIPTAYKTSGAPEMLSWDTTLHVFFRGYGDDDRLYHATWEGSAWDVRRMPAAYSKSPPSVTLFNNQIYVAYSGHNNTYIWLRKIDPSTGSWQSLGYVEGLSTLQRPALVGTETRLKLAFRSTRSNDICVGNLVVDEGVAPGAPGHTWYGSTGTGCD